MCMRWEKLSVQGAPTPTIKNHTATVVSDHELLVFGGYDGRRNHNTLYRFDCRTLRWQALGPGVTSGTPPAGRNGHTATLADRKRLFVIGGWLGSGPLAAADTHVLALDTMSWHHPPTRGTPPGPCNMHTADYIAHLRSILVFRGGDGREYLNDLHALHVDTLEWRKLHSTGEIPAPRANHSSVVVGAEQQHMLIFGGWDGQKRLNDMHVLDTFALTWSRVDTNAPALVPHPRAGMTLASHRDRIFLFGGSGPSAKCYNDLHIYDPKGQIWMETLVATTDDADESDEVGTTNDVSASGSSARSSNTSSGHENAQEMGGGVTLTAQQLMDYGMYGDGDANPNDNPHQDQIVILGHGPGRRAGHTCSVVDRKLFVFGGSYGSEYLNDFYVLDTDPPPRAAISYASSTQTLQHSLKHFMNSPEFSDIAFLVEGRLVYAHKIILSLLSDRFRGMFTAGFREAQQKEIVVPEIRYVVFLKMMEYLYTGHIEDRCALDSPNGNDVQEGAMICQQQQQDDEGDLGDGFGDFELMLELLVVADQFMLDHLKQICERSLQHAVTSDTVDYILEAADQSNALQLRAICKHFLRNHKSSRDSAAGPAFA